MLIGINIKDDDLEIKALASEETATIILDESRINQIITLYKTHGHPVFNAEELFTTICNIFNISITDFKSKSRKRDLVVARQLSMYVLKRLDFGTYSKIGIIIGNKDHATVMYGCKCVEDMIKYHDIFYYGKIKTVLKIYNLL